jgi:hypothetical protein
MNQVAQSPASPPATMAQDPTDAVEKKDPIAFFFYLFGFLFVKSLDSCAIVPKAFLLVIVPPD